MRKHTVKSKIEAYELYQATKDIKKVAEVHGVDVTMAYYLVKYGRQYVEGKMFAKHRAPNKKAAVPEVVTPKEAQEEVRQYRPRAPKEDEPNGIGWFSFGLLVGLFIGIVF